MLSCHALQPRQSKVRRILIAFRNAIHQVDQHLWVFLEFLHLYCIRQDHVKIEHQISHLHTHVIHNNSHDICMWQLTNSLHCTIMLKTVQIEHRTNKLLYHTGWISKHLSIIIKLIPRSDDHHNRIKHIIIVCHYYSQYSFKSEKLIQSVYVFGTVILIKGTINTDMTFQFQMCAT